MHTNTELYMKLQLDEFALLKCVWYFDQFSS